MTCSHYFTYWYSFDKKINKKKIKIEHLTNHFGLAIHWKNKNIRKHKASSLPQSLKHSFWIRCSLRPGFWPDHRVVQMNFFLKNQNNIILIKKKTNELQPGLAGSHRVFSFPVFSSTRSGSSPGSAGSRADQVLKLFFMFLFFFSRRKHKVKRWTLIRIIEMPAKVVSLLSFFIDA